MEQEKFLKNKLYLALLGSFFGLYLVQMILSLAGIRGNVPVYVLAILFAMAAAMILAVGYLRRQLHPGAAVSFVHSGHDHGKGLPALFGKEAAVRSGLRPGGGRLSVGLGLRSVLGRDLFRGHGGHGPGAGQVDLPLVFQFAPQEGQVTVGAGRKISGNRSGTVDFLPKTCILCHRKIY